MVTSVEALPAEEFAAWSQPQEMGSEPRGLTVINELGCTGCHSLDGTEGIGPSLYQLNGQQRKLTAEGKSFELSIDADYLRRAIREPNAEVVEGYQPMMPPYDEAALSEEDLQEVVDYLLGKVAAAKSRQIDAQELLENNGCVGCHSNDGSEGIAPTFKGIGGRQVTIVRDSEELTITVDADYLRRALLKPNSDLVKGYPGIMPSADYLSNEEIEAIVEHLLRQ
jgi:cytochrome c oxidase subunit 2